MADRLDDRWNHTDYPVLLEAVRLMTTTPDGWARVNHLEEGLANTHTPKDIQDAATRLSRAGYFTINGSFGKAVMRISQPTERALKATGIWPNDDFSDASEDLIRFLDHQVETAPPEERKWWQRVRDTFTEAGQDVAAKVIAEIVARQAGL
jgi:hypothetical protein